MKRRVCMASMLGFAVSGALAQSSGRYPDKPVRVVVTVPPGGASDFVARAMAESLGRELGAPIVIDNRAGANGTIASAHVAKAAPDGLTFLQAAISTHGIGPYFYEKLSYDPFKDLVPVAPIAEFPMILAVNAQLPAQSLRDLLALAKVKPLSYASAGTGSAPHLCGELLRIETGVNLNHVAYKGSGPAVQDVAAGQVDMMFDGIPSLLPHIRSGRLRPIAAVSAARNRLMPDIPTFSELGYPSMVASIWYGLMAPTGTSAAVISQVNAAVNRTLASVDLQKKLEENGALVMQGSAADFGAFMLKDHARWGDVIRRAGVSTKEN